MFQYLRRLFGTEAEPIEKTEGESNLSCDAAATSLVQQQTRDKITGCLLGLAVGDAKGMPAESKNPEYAEWVANTFDYVDGYLPAGHYTDDTHHSIILGESLVASRGWDAEDFMKRLSHLDPRRGIGPTTLRAIQNYNKGAPALNAGQSSSTNGSSMRIAPLAVVYRNQPELLLSYAIESSKVTHNSPEAIGAAVAVSYSIAHMLAENKETFDPSVFRRKLQDVVRSISPTLADTFDEDAILPERHGCGVLETIPHAIQIFLQHPYDFEKAIKEAVAGAGDADTIAAIVGALSGALNGAKAIPAKWLKGLENGPKGKDYLVALADALASIREFPPEEPPSF